MDDLESGVDPDTSVREYRCAYAVDDLERKVGGIDTAREELSIVKVDGLVEFDCWVVNVIISLLELSERATDVPSAPIGPVQLLFGGKNERS